MHWERGWFGRAPLWHFNPFADGGVGRLQSAGLSPWRVGRLQLAGLSLEVVLTLPLLCCVVGGAVFTLTFGRKVGSALLTLPWLVSTVDVIFLTLPCPVFLASEAPVIETLAKVLCLSEYCWLASCQFVSFLFSFWLGGVWAGSLPCTLFWYWHALHSSLTTATAGLLCRQQCWHWFCNFTWFGTQKPQ